MRNMVGSTRLFVAGFMLLQVAWLVTIPPFRGSDEFDHVYRAASVATGQWLSRTAADNGRGALVEVPGSLVDEARAQCAVLEYVGPDNCYPVRRAGDERVVIASAASGYNPVYYLVVGVAARPFEGATALYMMRSVSALLCLCVLGLGAWAVGPRSWQRLAFVLSLSPVIAYSSIVVAPNGLEIAAGVTLWSALLALGGDEEPRRPAALFWLAVGATCLLLTLRLLGPLLALLILASAFAYLGEPLWRRVRMSPWRLTVGTLLTGCVAGASASWILYARQTVPAGDAGDPSSLNPLRGIVWAAQTIAAFPFRNQPGPLVVYVVVGFLVTVLWVFAARGGSWRARLSLVMISVIALLGPVVLTLLTKESQGVIWQGRYGLPYTVGMVIVSGVILSRAGVRAPPPWVSLMAMGALAVSSVACLLKIRTDELGRPASLDDESWWTPSPIYLALLVGASALVLIAWAQSAPAHDQLSGRGKDDRVEA